MWKLLLGFVIFGAFSIFMLLKGGDKVDMAGESAGHSIEGSAVPAPTPAPTPAPATPPANSSVPAAGK